MPAHRINATTRQVVESDTERRIENWAKAMRCGFSLYAPSYDCPLGKYYRAGFRGRPEDHVKVLIDIDDAWTVEAAVVSIDNVVYRKVIALYYVHRLDLKAITGIIRKSLRVRLPKPEKTLKSAVMALENALAKTGK